MTLTDWLLIVAVGLLLIAATGQVILVFAVSNIKVDTSRIRAGLRELRGNIEKIAEKDT